MTSEAGAATPAAAEGALLAHRRLIEALFSVVAETAADGSRLVDAIERRLGLSDGQEDPGAVPDRAYAVQRACDQEIALTLRAVRERIALAPGPAARDPGLG